MTPPAPAAPGAGDRSGAPLPLGDDAQQSAVGRAGAPWWGPPAAALLFRLLWPVRVHQADAVPALGPVLFASNHVGLLDGPLLVAVAPRYPHCLVKQEMFHGPAGLVLRAAGQIPVDRARGDREALSRALQVLAAGGAVGVFPEGTRGRGDVGAVRQGIAWLALRSGAPVVPVACLGTRRSGESTGRLPPLRRRLDIVFGAPLRLTARSGVPGRVALAEAAGMVRDTMAAHVVAAQARTGQALPDDPGRPPEQTWRGEHP